MNFKEWYENADMPTKDEFGWYDEETGIAFSEEYYEKAAAAKQSKEKKQQEARGAADAKNSLREKIRAIKEKAHSLLSDEEKSKLKELIRSLDEIKQVEDDMKMLKENPSLYYM